MIPTGLASTAQIYHKLLEIYGLDADQFFREAGFGAALPGDPDARVQVKSLDFSLTFMVFSQNRF